MSFLLKFKYQKMIEICKANNIMMKAHNTDYLSDEALKWHPRLGIHAANVAPEFGVAESKALVNCLEQNALNQLAEEFLELAYSSRKWEKWMIKGTSASDRDRAMITRTLYFLPPRNAKKLR